MRGSRKISQVGGGGVQIPRRGLTENFNMAKDNNLAIPIGMQISNSKFCEASIKCRGYSTVNDPWWVSMLFPPTGFVVAWLGCSL